MEAQLFEPGTVPECSTPEWYAERDRAPHLEEWVHAKRLATAAEFARKAVTEYGCKTISDLGAGDGGLLSLLSDVDALRWGYDLQPSNIVGAKVRNVNVLLADVLFDPISFGECSIATEMIEHLIDPHGFVRRVGENSRVIVASSPVNETAESHYAFHLWAWDMEGYRGLIEQGAFTVVEHRNVGEFQVIMGVKP